MGETFTPARAELIRLRRNLFLWSIPVALACALVFRGGAEMARGTAAAPVAAAVGLIALVWPLVCLYKLSRAVDPQRMLAWGMVALQIVPVIGLVAAVALVLKANSAIKAGAVASAQPRGDSPAT